MQNVPSAAGPPVRARSDLEHDGWSTDCSLPRTLQCPSPHEARTGCRDLFSLPVEKIRPERSAGSMSAFVPVLALAPACPKDGVRQVALRADRFGSLLPLRSKRLRGRRQHGVPGPMSCAGSAASTRRYATIRSELTGAWAGLGFYLRHQRLGRGRSRPVEQITSRS